VFIFFVSHRVLVPGRSLLITWKVALLSFALIFFLLVPSKVLRMVVSFGTLIANVDSLRMSLRIISGVHVSHN
jgi:hypothetical protein